MVQEVRRLEHADGLLHKLDLAEAFNVAYIGSKPDKHRANVRQLTSWRRDTWRQIEKLLHPAGARQTIWDNLRKKSRRL